jgi:putative FmdB family regulatory protein
MPVYEYVCEKCDTRFEQLRPSRRMNDAASCPEGHRRSHRVLSTFAALTKDSAGEVESVGGSGCGGGCSNCTCSN